MLEELEYEEAAKLTRRGVPADTAQRRAEKLIAQMAQAFDDATVEGWEGLVDSYGLQDPDDEHVVAAAVVAGAGVIVTDNLKDFPPDLMPPGIEVQDPAVFATHTVSVDPHRGAAAVEKMASRSGQDGPSTSIEDVLDLLEDRYGMTDATAMLRQALDAR